MTTRIFTLAAIALAFPLTVLAASEHSDHSTHKATTHKIELNAGKKWETDESLRKAMSSMRTSIVTTLPNAHAGKVSNAEYDTLAKDLGGQIAYIVENCKLDPKADAQLHILVADIVSGIETVEGKQQNKKRALGVVKVAQALNTYGKYFNHEGFQPIKMPH